MTDCSDEGEGSDLDTLKLKEEPLRVGDVIWYYEYLGGPPINAHAVVVGISCDTGRNVVNVYPGTRSGFSLPDDYQVSRLAKFSFETSKLSFFDKDEYRQSRPLNEFTMRPGGEQCPLSALMSDAKELKDNVRTVDTSEDKKKHIPTSTKKYGEAWKIIMAQHSAWAPKTRDDDSDDDDSDDDKSENGALNSTKIFDMTNEPSIENITSANVICSVKLLKYVVGKKKWVDGRFDLQRSTKDPYADTLLLVGHKVKEDGTGTDEPTKYKKSVYRADVRFQTFIMDSDGLDSLKAMKISANNERILGLPHVAKITVLGEEVWHCVMLVKFQSISGLMQIFDHFNESTMIPANKIAQVTRALLPLSRSEYHPPHWSGRDLDWKCPLSFVCPEGTTSQSRIKRETVNEIARHVSDVSLRRVADGQLVWNERMPVCVFFDEHSFSSLQKEKWLNDDIVDALVYWYVTFVPAMVS